MEPYSTPQAMKRVGDLFEKYKTKLKAPQASVEKECVLVINTITGFTLTQDQLTYTVSTRTLALKIPSLLKSELRFHHEAILRELENRLGKDGCPKVIL
ncbi:hypothetical protein KC906_00560 [Candidatus Kaiserbacteria bacterium]|nr:hypothetical protein [Candidatus Kaiserbacteria bacterium]MCB9812405.1 hypothetical protein [Candidatus Nomurabacteria bacterium]